MAPLEAMACGLPVVASCAPGVVDILGDAGEFGGFVVPTDDAPSLASHVGRLLDDDQAALELGARARTRVEQAFSLGAAGERLKALLGARRVT